MIKRIKKQNRRDRKSDYAISVSNSGKGGDRRIQKKVEKLHIFHHQQSSSQHYNHNQQQQQNFSEEESVEDFDSQYKKFKKRRNRSCSILSTTKCGTFRPDRKSIYRVARKERRQDQESSRSNLNNGSFFMKNEYSNSNSTIHYKGGKKRHQLSFLSRSRRDGGPQRRAFRGGLGIGFEESSRLQNFSNSQINNESEIVQRQEDQQANQPGRRRPQSGNLRSRKKYNQSLTNFLPRHNTSRLSGLRRRPEPPLRGGRGRESEEGVQMSSQPHQISTLSPHNRSRQLGQSTILAFQPQKSTVHHDRSISRS